MEGNKSKPRAILVFGAPCSGRSTFAEKFSKKFKLAAYDFDEISEKYDFSREDLLTILELILRTKQSIVIEGCLETERDRMEIRNVLRRFGYDPALVWIQTDISTIRSRLKNKFKSVSKAKNYYDNIVAEIEAPAESEKAIVLSGKHTFETQSKHVIAGLADLAKNK